MDRLSRLVVHEKVELENTRRETDEKIRATEALQKDMNMVIEIRSSGSPIGRLGVSNKIDRSESNNFGLI